MSEIIRQVNPKAIGKSLLQAYLELTYRRKCRLYCVGLPKTGTVSVASMFSPSIRTGHEATAKEIIARFIDLPDSNINNSSHATWVRDRDKRIRLDVDSSHVNILILEYLVSEFPDARFLLTIRDCQSWLKSFVGHTQRKGTAQEHWRRYREYRFRPDLYPHPEQEHELKQKGFYSVDGYLSNWSKHNHKVLRTVPSDKLMIVKTNEITSKIQDISKFTGLSDMDIVVGNSYKHKSKDNSSILDNLPVEYINQKIEQHCGDLMQRFFPEILL